MYELKTEYKRRKRKTSMILKHKLHGLFQLLNKKTPRNAIDTNQILSKDMSGLNQYEYVTISKSITIIMTDHVLNIRDWEVREKIKTIKCSEMTW